MKILSAFLFLLLSCILNAQNFEVTVLNMNSSPMPYAYILVNHKPVEITDSRGKAALPLDALSENDTISISYLGVAPAYVIYDKTLAAAGKYSFMLDESAYMLNEVVVEYTDIGKLFKRSNKSLPGLNYNCIMTADFSAMIKIPLKTYQVIGKLEGENEVWSKKFTYRSKGWFHHPVDFKTADDTSGISKMLSIHTHFALNYMYKALDYSTNHMLDHYKPSYTYLGEKENNKVFRITYPDNMVTGFPFQIILYVDKDTKHISSAELLTIEKKSADSRNNYMIRMKCDCTVYTHKKPLMNTVYLTDSLQYSYEIPSGKVIEILITNPKIK